MVSIESKIYNKSSGNETIIGATIILYNDVNNEITRVNVVDEQEVNNLKSKLNVIDETYIKYNENSHLKGRTIDDILNNSLQNIDINATKLSGTPKSSFSQVGHDHDDRYYTESEITSKLSGKANSVHTHNSATNTDDGFMSSSDKNKLDNIVYDSGWQRPILNPIAQSVFVEYDKARSVRYRRKNSIVQIIGAVKPTAKIVLSGAQTMPVLKLPSDCCPPQDLVILQQGTDSFRFVMIINRDGMVYISRYTNNTSIGQNIPQGAWLNLNCTYMV